MSQEYMESEKYRGCSIVNIRVNKRTGNIHANVMDKDGTLLISATLDYCARVVETRFPRD